MAQYEKDFANPGLYHRVCRDLRLKEDESLNVDSLVGQLQALDFDYERLLFIMIQESLASGEVMVREALHGRADLPQS